MKSTALIDSPSDSEQEASAVFSWRCEELRRAGYGFEEALILAISVEVDLHLATGLLARGCPPSLAMEILL